MFTRAYTDLMTEQAPQRVPSTSEKRIAAATKARATRTAKGSARQLKSPELRWRLFLFWMDQFHTTTRSILIHLGMTAGDLRIWSKDKLIQSRVRSFKPTSRSMPRTISSIFLTKRGLEKKKALFPNERPSSPPNDQNFSHDLVLQAYLAELVRKDELRSFLGPAQIRAGALKDRDTREGFGLEHGKAGVIWRFDALIKGINKKSIALELERTPKVKVKDLQHFFDKLNDAGQSALPILILAESEACAQTWQRHLLEWRTKGRPAGKRAGDLLFDGHTKLTDLGRTAVTHIPTELFNQIISGARNPSGRSGKSKPPVKPPSGKDIDALIQQASSHHINHERRRRLEDLRQCLDEVALEKRSQSLNDLVQPELELRPLLGQLGFLTLDEIESLLSGNASIDVSELASRMWTRNLQLSRLLDRTSNPPPSQPLALSTDLALSKRGFFGFTRS